MPLIVTSTAVIQCSHQGIVTLIPRQTQVSITGGFVLCEPDLVGAPIVGCTQPPTPVTKPCTTVVSTLPGSSAPNIAVVGRPPYLQTLVGVTDGVPPGAVTVAFAGQTVVQA